MRLILVFIGSVFLTACSFFPPYQPQPEPLQLGRLPTPDRSVEIANLGPCTDSKDRTLKFNSTHPITVLVHGCKGSAGRFRSLAQLYAFHGQQAICYSYNDRDSLTESADKLAIALQELAIQTLDKNISVIGHSLGGLVARKSMEDNHSHHWERADININLITVSAPIAGIDAASSCGSSTFNWLSLGVIPAICWGITGDNWYQITPRSDFINYPEPLSASVQRYLKVVTNEKNSCRTVDSKGKCIKSDEVFAIDEQYQPVIDNYPQITSV
ncbi:esterase/lipase family protein, partial [Psychromonas antarctica]|uniref:esterase/lipase family protein n=1 Tax=Psychromonas antarctica TaxID=67573 RepID=UPI001EE94003